MNNVLMRVRDGINAIVFGSTIVCCETCGATLRPHRAVWRGQRSYCSVAHEHADLDTGDFSSSFLTAPPAEDASPRMRADLVRF